MQDSWLIHQKLELLVNQSHIITSTLLFSCKQCGIGYDANFFLYSFIQPMNEGEKEEENGRTGIHSRPFSQERKKKKERL